jgi:predicted nuclease of predicted toxin-antitoxin system
VNVLIDAQLPRRLALHFRAAELEALLTPNLSAIEAALAEASFVELTRTSLIIHE